MKKTLLMLALAGLCATDIMAQREDFEDTSNLSEFMQESRRVYRFNTAADSLSLTPGAYMVKSGKFQGAALGMGVASMCSCLAGCLIEDEITEDGEFKDRSDRRKGFFIASGVFGIAAVICEACSIRFKLLSGRAMQLTIDGNGAGIKIAL